MRKRGVFIPSETKGEESPERGPLFPTPQKALPSAMSQERLPLIGPSGSKKAAAKSSLSFPTPQHPSQASRLKRSQHQQPSSPPSSLLSLHPDTTMSSWAGHSFSESSFTSIPRPPPHLPPPPPPLPPPPPKPPRAHQPKPSSPYPERHNAAEEVEGSCPRSPPFSLPNTAPQDSSAGRSGRGLRSRRRVMPQRRMPRAPRLPPLHPVTNLSFSRSFTFSFFELPLHQTPRCRADHIRNLALLLRQIQY